MMWAAGPFQANVPRSSPVKVTRTRRGLSCSTRITRTFRITRRVNGVVDVMEVPSDYTLLPGDTVYVYERIL